MATARDASPLDGRRAEEVTIAPLKGIERGFTVENLQGVSQEAIDGIYRYVYEFYQQGRLDDAEVLFRNLCIYDFYNADYTMGFAAVCQLKRNYVKAIDLYAFTFALSKRDYRPMFHAGQCQLMRGEAALACGCFRKVIEFSEDERLKRMAASYLKGIDEIGRGSGQARSALEERHGSGLAGAYTSETRE